MQEVTWFRNKMQLLVFQLATTSLFVNKSLVSMYAETDTHTCTDTHSLTHTLAQGSFEWIFLLVGSFISVKKMILCVCSQQGASVRSGFVDKRSIAVMPELALTYQGLI